MHKPVNGVCHLRWLVNIIKAAGVDKINELAGILHHKGRNPIILEPQRIRYSAGVKLVLNFH